jgi:hypothetical protein
MCLLGDGHWQASGRLVYKQALLWFLRRVCRYANDRHGTASLAACLQLEVWLDRYWYEMITPISKQFIAMID